jgi:fibronectin-binding autotransporter adhesin
LLGGNYTTNDLTVSGTLVASASETITVNGNLDLSAAGTNYEEATSTLIMGGAVTPSSVTLAAPAAAGEEEFYDLTIQKAITTDDVILQTNITVLNSLIIASGTLSAQTYTIYMQGSLWENQVGTVAVPDGFDPGTGEVIFLNDVTIRGSSQWFDFTCATPGTTIQFETLQEQTILNNGTFTIQGGAGNLIRLKPIGVAWPLPCPPPIAATNNPLPPPTYNEQWMLTISSPNGNAVIDFAEVQLCYSGNGKKVTPGPNSENYCYNDNWAFIIPIRRSWTIDSNRNGRIDRIRVQVEIDAPLSDTFSGLTAAVSGYTVIGFDTADFPGDDVFDIIIQESPYLDTDATPSWQLTENLFPIGLYGTAGGAYVQSGDMVYQTVDGARPVIAYTLAAFNDTRVYVQFSEVVYGNNSKSAPIDSGDFNVTGNSITGVETINADANGGTRAAYVDLTNPLTAADILPPGQQTINAVIDSIFQAPYPLGPYVPAFPDYDDTNPPYQPNPNPMAPSFSGYNGVTGFDGVNDPAPGVDNLPWPDNTVRATELHNISDVGLGFIEPVWAANVQPAPDLVTEIPERDPLRGGIGRITRFDGREAAWLQVRDIRLQANVVEPSIAGSTVDLYFDANTRDPILLNDLWIPAAHTLWPPVVPPPPAWPTYPQAPYSDTFHNENTAARPVTPDIVSGSLRDFIIPASDSEMADGADLEFLFVINVGGTLFPFARIPNPHDPSTARPWVIKIRDLRTQRGGATITNNVINPLRGETAKVTYSITQTGMVTINVFDLKGDIVDVLYRGQRTAGEYSTTWDGRNRGNRVVARGVYFIKIVGPGISEIRKVLVVK